MYYCLYITDYNNGYEKGYHSFSVLAKDYERDWETICNQIKTSQAIGLDGTAMQLWFQDNEIPFIYIEYETQNEFFKGFEGTGLLNKATMSFTGKSAELRKIVPHTNIGNY